MTQIRKKPIFAILILFSFISSVYLNIELNSIESAIAIEGQVLPDVSMLKSLVKMVLSPLMDV